MTRVVELNDVEAAFDDLIHAVEKGAEIVVEQAGRPVAKIVPYTPAQDAADAGSTD